MSEVVWQKRSQRLFIGLAVVLVTLALLRLWVGSSWVQEKIADRLAQQAQTHGLFVHVAGKIDLGFTGKLTLANVMVTHPLAQAQVQELSVAPEWWAWAMGRPFFAEVVAKHLTVSARGRTLEIQALHVWAEGHALLSTGALGGGMVHAALEEIAPKTYALNAELHDVATSALGLGNDVMGIVSLTLQASLYAATHQLEGDVQVQLQDAFVDAAWLSRDVVGPFTVEAFGHFFGNREADVWRLDNGTLAVGSEAAPLLELSVLKNGQSFDIATGASINATDLYDALPPQLTPVVGAPRLLGRCAGKLNARGNLDEPEQWQVNATINLSDAITQAKQAPPILRDTFVHTTQDKLGKIHTVLVGPKNPLFVGFGELPEHVMRAVTTSEDGGFFAHQGFDLDEMKNSLVAVAQAGRAVRGGSTITQQLAKNLYLSREKTYARKAQEALITLALEASVKKPRLLEIYLNIIEWGPGIYGIGHAAQHYFGKDARALTPKEAAYLASIIPNPVRFGWHAQKGELTETWEERVLSVLSKMNEAGALDAESFEAAKASALVFSSAN